MNKEKLVFDLDCVDAHIYQEIRATDMKYKNRVRSRISNLKDPKNPGLRRNVLAGSIELSRMASMSAEVTRLFQSDQLSLHQLWFSSSLFVTHSPVIRIALRKWPVTSWNSWGTSSPRRPSGNTRWPKRVGPPQTCCSAASARRRIALTTR